MQDKLGPLMTHSLTGGQQLQLLSPAGVLSAAGVRQVPVGIITLEDVIEELMQVGAGLPRGEGRWRKVKGRGR